jgi:ribose/xylose/arabinose/galactoside ABC-type transport system permease subunit
MMQEQVNPSPLERRRPEFGLGDILRNHTRTLWTVAALILILLANRLISANFFTVRMVNGRLIGSPISILDLAAPIVLLSIGMTLVIATKGVDLSVGAVMAICSATAVVLINRYEAGSNNILYTPGFVILIAIGVGALCGLWNGILVAYFDIQPIVATLILMIAGRGIAQMITEGQSPTFTNETLAFIGRGTIFGLPFPIYMSLAVLLAVYLFVRRTALGMMIESVGINAKASFYAGIKAARIKLFVYILSGMCAALAGLKVAGEVKSADPHKAGEWSELDAILAVVIGGTLITSAIGALIIQSLVTGLYVSKLHPTANLVVKAIVVLAVLLLQSPEFRGFTMRPLRRRS